MSRKRSTIPWLEVRDGVYYVFWYDSTAKRTKRRSLEVPEANAVEGQRRFARFLSEGHQIFSGGPGGTVGLSVERGLDDYWREHVTEKVIDKERQETIIRHLKAHFKDTSFSAIDILASRAYRDARRAGTIGGGKRRKDGRASDSTIRRELVTLQAAANHAAAWRRIGPNATPPSIMPSIELTSEIKTEAITDDDWLTKAELKRAIATAAPRVRDFMDVGYYTAGRRESIERMTKWQVNLGQSQIDLRRPDETALQRASKKRRPKVPIDPLLRPTIERLMTATGPECEWLFGDGANMYRPFRRHMERIGLGHKSNPHILRHSRASHLLQDGVSIYDVAKLLGDTVKTVETTYGHHSPEHIAQAIARKTKDTADVVG